MPEPVSISIDMLPEFGWSINNQPAYGPGSVFQGFIKIVLNEDIPIENVRIAFYATETFPPFEACIGTVRSAKHILFSIQATLWEAGKDKALELDEDNTTTFPFTIQMPMVQFPSSLISKYYECRFQLIALVNTETSSFKQTKPVIYMPYVETSLLKTPFLVSVDKSSPLSLQIKMPATEFVPGDIMPVSLHVGCPNTSRKTRYVTVQLQLIQKISVKIFPNIPECETAVASVEHKLLLIPNDTGSYCDGDFTLKLPSTISPTCNYSNMTDVTYQLQVKVEQKGPLGGIWNYTVDMEDIDITIGTLGYGIRVSNDFVKYSTFPLNSENRLVDVPHPKFMKSIEYEDALPVYDPARLPDYNPFTAISSAIC
ncbi:hypothetical protein BY458DRAFT_503709 [Sporodiniella umbellata]|nr:hypothetical protein BY458DRAFT_503709 [Sporodiniella umbellata]